MTVSPSQFETIPHTLADTIPMMESPDDKARLLAEYFQLWIRTDKLGQVLEKINNGTVEFEPRCPTNLLISQYQSMLTYLSILQHRLEIEITDDQLADIICRYQGHNDN